MSAGSPRRFPSSRQLAEVAHFLNDPRVIKYLSKPKVIDEDHDVPDFAGYSIDGGTIFLDRHLASAAPVIAGTQYEVWKQALIGPTDWKPGAPSGHEPVEKAAILLGHDYADAHEDYATPSEHLVLVSLRINPTRYEKELRPFIKRTEIERIENPPLDLDCHPYWDHPDANDLRVLKRLAELGVTDAVHQISKLPHEAVSYGPGHGKEFCRTCEHSDHKKPPTCEIVRDPIKPGGWCTLWKPGKAQ